MRIMSIVGESVSGARQSRARGMPVPALSRTFCTVPVPERQKSLSALQNIEMSSFSVLMALQSGLCQVAV